MLRRKSVYRKYPGYQIGIIELDCEDRDAIAAELERLADLEEKKRLLMLQGAV